jgi:hypothetical protein
MGACVLAGVVRSGPRRLLSVAIAAVALAGCGLIPGTGPGRGAVPEAVAAALAVACPGLNDVEGQAVPGTATAKALESNHLVVLGPQGKVSAWTGEAPADWAPPTLDDAELVACLDTDGVADEFEVCTYDDGSTITRVRYFLPVEIYEAATGRAIELASLGPMGSINGADPEACPPTKESAPRAGSRLEGERPGWDDVQPLLASLVAGEGLGAVDLTIEGGDVAGTYVLTDFDCRREPGPDGTIWRVEAWHEIPGTSFGSWDRYVAFAGYDGPGGAELKFRANPLRLYFEVRIGSGSDETTFEVRLDEKDDESVGDFSVTTRGGQTVITASGLGGFGRTVDVHMTAVCPEVHG